MKTIGTEKEALINELKGNLFEYLLALSLSKIHQVEGNFYNSFQGEIKKRLIGYEGILLKNDPFLFKKLPILAQEMAKEINKVLPAKVDNILVVGKGAFRFNLKEADLIVESGEDLIPLSIKLCKANSFVNTKSAGVKSFIKTYFNRFPKHDLWQRELNVVVDLSFERMARILYEKAGLRYIGGFSKDWYESGFSDLPGKLPLEMRKIVRDFYFEINSKIYDIFIQMEKESSEEFKDCLPPLLGFGDKSIIQATCYHKEVFGEKYFPVKISINRADPPKEWELGNLKNGLSSFELKIPGRILQIRVKPMNVFTTPAVKINCSTKDLL
jgi:hypothetical protein